MNNTTKLTNSSTVSSAFNPIYEVFGIITIPIGATGLLGSILCLWTIWQSGVIQRKSSSNVLFLNLCMSTLLFSIIVCPLHAYAQIAQFASVLSSKSDVKLCRFVAFTYFWTLTASAYGHSAIALNRFFAVVISGKYRDVFQTKWCTGSMIVLSWAIAGATFMPPLFAAGGTYGFSNESMKCTFTSLTSQQYVVLYKVLYGLVPFVIMIVCYVCIFLKVAWSKRRIRVQQHRIEAVGSKQASAVVKAVNKHKVMKGELRITKIAFLTCLSFLCFYLPSAIYGFVVKTREELQSPLGISMVYLWWIGCAMNPILYAYLNSALRQRIFLWLSQRQHLGKIFRAKQSSTVNESTLTKRQSIAQQMDFRHNSTIEPSHG